MITIPRSRPDHWSRRRDWRQYAEKLFRFYSQRHTYTLDVRKQPGHIAYVNTDSRMVHISPDLIELPAADAKVRFRPSPEDVTDSLLRVLLAHEAGHVRYSCRKPAGVVGQIWNALEDERVERLMASEYRRLEPLFTFLGDTLLARTAPEFDGSSMEGVLVWRWSRDNPHQRWTPAEPDEWASIRPLVEEAWQAETSEQVVELATEIVELLGLKEQQDELPPEVEARVERIFGEVTASGGGAAEADEEAEAGQGDDGAETDDGQDVSGEGKPGTARQGQNGTDAIDQDAAHNGQGGIKPGMEEPKRPAVDPSTSGFQYSQQILSEVESSARRLAESLVPPEKRSFRVNTRSRGRFSYDRYATGSERPFRLRDIPVNSHRPIIRILHDVSGSMGSATTPGTTQYVAARMLIMLQRACELSGTTVAMHGFDTMVRETVGLQTPPELARMRLAALNGFGGTTLTPGILAEGAVATADTYLFVLSDGAISPTDGAACKPVIDAYPGIIMPVLVGAAVSNVNSYKELFGRVIAVTEIEALPDAVKTWLERAVTARRKV